MSTPTRTCQACAKKPHSTLSTPPFTLSPHVPSVRSCPSSTCATLTWMASTSRCSCQRTAGGHPACGASSLSSSRGLSARAARSWRAPLMARCSSTARRATRVRPVLLWKNSSLCLCLCTSLCVRPHAQPLAHTNPLVISGAERTSCEVMECSADGALLINGAPCDPGAARLAVKNQQPAPLSMHQSLCPPTCAAARTHMFLHPSTANVNVFLFQNPWKWAGQRWGTLVQTTLIATWTVQHLPMPFEHGSVLPRYTCQRLAHTVQSCSRSNTCQHRVILPRRSNSCQGCRRVQLPRRRLPLPRPGGTDLPRRRPQRLQRPRRLLPRPLLLLHRLWRAGLHCHAL